MIIYKTTNLINNKIYVGKDSNNNPSYFGSGKILKLAITKYGKVNFKKEILEFCNASNINEKEIYWIDKLNCRNSKIGYNITAGGDGVSSDSMLGEKNPNFGKYGKDHHCYGTHHSKETRKKISLSNKGCAKFYGHKHSEATKIKMSKAQSGCNNAMYGKKQSLETLEKQRTKKIGRHRSEETKRKMSEARKLYWKKIRLNKDRINY